MLVVLIQKLDQVGRESGFPLANAISTLDSRSYVAPVGRDDYVDGELFINNMPVPK